MDYAGTLHPVKSLRVASSNRRSKTEGIGKGSRRTKDRTRDIRKGNFHHPFPKLDSLTPPDSYKRTPLKNFEVSLS